MNNSEEHLSKALEEWSFSSEPDRQLASHILQLADQLLLSIASVGNVGVSTGDLWKKYLHLTSRPRYLLSLSSDQDRHRWAETTFKAIPLVDFRLRTSLDFWAEKTPNNTFLQESGYGLVTHWSYSRARDRIRAIACVLLSSKVRPKVALFTANCAEGAMCDLACLLYDIFVTPINIHTDPETLKWMFERLHINTVITDTEERRKVLLSVTGKLTFPVTVFSLQEAANPIADNAQLLGKQVSRLGIDEIDKVLKNRSRMSLFEVSTVLFTSGSTGKPKGVSFTQYQLISKRFARAAALPFVGDNEVLLAYLPLYHTFGRYFELTGMLFWGGTYTFAGNPSPETLFAQLPVINPTGMISIPLRWIQLYERLSEAIDTAGVKIPKHIIQSITGTRLRWGLSAAGYLNPKIFRFFQSLNIELCSGFGMTEATGGITMSPPGDYRDNTVGKPLPGVIARLSGDGELQVKGPYITRYLEDAEPGDTIPLDDDYWLCTGDLFKETGENHYRIVDRIKDIYKNSKGQTIAPRRVENIFRSVQGIRQTFLVGDGRDYNILLIVPDKSDGLIRDLEAKGALLGYYQQLVAFANRELAPYERVVNIAILDRDFSIDKDELTAKGSFKRKTIENNFKPLIDEQYKYKTIRLSFGKYTIILPRWFFRDLTVLETDIVVLPDGLFNKRLGVFLPVIVGPEKRVRIGLLEYILHDNEIDLGLFARQPKLWVGNPMLIDFCPCKDGWDVPLGNVEEQVILPHEAMHDGSVMLSDTPVQLRDEVLKSLNQHIQIAFFGDPNQAYDAVLHLGERLAHEGIRKAALIRRRLEALADHPNEDIRTASYRILLLDEPMADYGVVFPTFVKSGKSFLNEGSIRAIARSDLQSRRLDALRKRLYSYRTSMMWPGDDVTRNQFTNIFDLLVSFAKLHREYYPSVRSELASWILHDKDKVLSEKASEKFNQLVEWYEGTLEKDQAAYSQENWEQVIVFDHDISRKEKAEFYRLFVGTLFLKESIILAFADDTFSISKVKPQGIWISRIPSHHRYMRYRAAINTISGKHYDLQFVLTGDVSSEHLHTTNLWTLVLSGFPFTPPVLPRFGCCREELGALSLVYNSELTLWDKIREYAVSSSTPGTLKARNYLKKLFIQAFTAFFTAWSYSNNRIVPGEVTPVNVIVPEMDYREATRVVSLTSWKPFTSINDLIEPMINNFYLRTAAYYPWIKQELEYSWLFDSCMEALGQERTMELLDDLEETLSAMKIETELPRLEQAIFDYREVRLNEYYIPAAVYNAIDRYIEWKHYHSRPSRKASMEIVEELYRAYRIDKYGQPARFYLFRHTFFAMKPKKVRDAFDELLNVMFEHPDVPATQFAELSLLQSTFTSATDRDVFSQVVFPGLKESSEMEVMLIGEENKPTMVVRSIIRDRQENEFTFREPMDPSEIGRFYRLFYKEKYAKEISEQDRYYIVTDKHERMIGAICYHMQRRDIAFIDGIVVSRPRQRSGIGTAMIEEFCMRMKERKVTTIKLHFLLKNLGTKTGFEQDERWGGLVRFLK